MLSCENSQRNTVTSPWTTTLFSLEVNHGWEWEPEGVLILSIKSLYFGVIKSEANRIMKMPLRLLRAMCRLIRTRNLKPGKKMKLLFSGAILFTSLWAFTLLSMAIFRGSFWVLTALFCILPLCIFSLFETLMKR